MTARLTSAQSSQSYIAMYAGKTFGIYNLIDNSSTVMSIDFVYDHFDSDSLHLLKPSFGVLNVDRAQLGVRSYLGRVRVLGASKGEVLEHLIKPPDTADRFSLCTFMFN